MDIRLGLKVKLADPENPANVIVSQFATIRGNAAMRTFLDDCSRAEVAESVALRRCTVAQEELDNAASAGEIDRAAAALEEATAGRLAASNALIDAVHTFIVKGFELAGATPEAAETLAACVGMERLTELRVKCQFGAGVLDFTKAAQ